MPIAEFLAVNLDCGNPPELADFYSEFTGAKVTYSSDEYAAVEIAGSATVPRS